MKTLKDMRFTYEQVVLIQKVKDDKNFGNLPTVSQLTGLVDTEIKGFTKRIKDLESTRAKYRGLEKVLIDQVDEE